jgi:hypothetical protein
MVAWLGVTGVVRTERVVLVMGVLLDLSEFCFQVGVEFDPIARKRLRALSAWYLNIQW